MKTKFIAAISILIATVYLMSCASTKKIEVTPEEDETIVMENLDTLEIDGFESKLLAPRGTEYRATKTVTYDILHTDLDLGFDYQNQFVLGKALLDITPYFYPIEEITLDAVGFEIKEIKVQNAIIKNYTYDGKSLTVPLGKVYKKGDKFQVFIDYIAKPSQNQSIENFGAITSDNGLFFIDPLGTDPDKPTQIWSQGETENNKRWFPTFDKPTERFTQSIKLTVPDMYKTLSNGKLKESIKLPNNMRRDHWVQEKPHAVYLTMVAVGEWSVTDDLWQNVPLMYYVDQNFAPTAKQIFNHTPEMLSFFSGVLKYQYPWDKYAQVAVKDFVSGAMENTTAVIFGDFVQKNEKELIDNDNDYIVAHEMMHHWFGDLATCEDWSNLTLNEGFANYAEYLWAEHKYGRDKADHHRMEELSGYLSQVYSGGAHPLIDYFYTDKNKMFDAHSYNKGGLVLHHLRYYLGDEAFFEGLHHYLTKNANTSVEADELRIAFEDISGQDLHWFFDQWFFGTGHPNLDIQYQYDSTNKTVTIDVNQEGTSDDFTKPFALPLDVAMYYEGSPTQWEKVWVKKLRDTIVIHNVASKPDVINLDGNNTLIGLTQENKTAEEYKKQFRLSPLVFDKIVAISRLTGDDLLEIIPVGMKEKYAFIRQNTINSIPEESLSNFTETLQDLAMTDPNSEVRAAAFQALLMTPEYDPTTVAETLMKVEKTYPVLQMAVSVLKQVKPEALTPYLANFKNDSSDGMALILAEMMGDEDATTLQFFNQKSKTIGVDKLNGFFTLYNEYLQGKSITTLRNSAENMYAILTDNNSSTFRKFYAAYTLAQTKQQIEAAAVSDENTMILDTINGYITSVRSAETNAELIQAYEMIFNPKKQP